MSRLTANIISLGDTVFSRRWGSTALLGLTLFACSQKEPAPAAGPAAIPKPAIIVTEYTSLWMELGITLPTGVPASLDESNLDNVAVKEGERLSHVYCAGCHIRPEPEVLHRKSWLVAFSMILPIMANRGLLSFEIPAKPRQTPGYPPPALSGRNDMWQRPYENYRLSQREMTLIAYYYFAAAREEDAPQVGKRPPSAAPAPFVAKHSHEYNSPRVELYTLAYIDEDEKKIIVAEALSRTLLFLNAAGKELQRIKLDGIPIHITKHKGYYYITLIGPEFSSGNWQHGEVVRLRAVSGLVSRKTEKVLRNLERPVMAGFADLEGNGKEGILVAEFGVFSGSLSWHRPTRSGQTEKRRIYDGSGVTTFATHDFNRDGKLDVVAPVSQNVESVVRFKNLGFGTFATDQVMKKHPAFGLNSMALSDLNGDGLEDVVVVNGDDPGVSREPRSYHGVRALLNDGKGGFAEKDLYPMYGALLVAARDFDLDGDPDLVVISYYPDMQESPPETLVYLENTGNAQFTPHRIEAGNTGRWMALGAGDIDGDGDSDFVVAANEPPTGDIEDWDRAFRRTSRAGYLIFENTTRSVKSK